MTDKEKVTMEIKVPKANFSKTMAYLKRQGLEIKEIYTRGDENIFVVDATM